MMETIKLLILRYYYVIVLAISFVVSFKNGHYVGITAGMLLVSIAYALYDFMRRR